MVVFDVNNLHVCMYCRLGASIVVENLNVLPVFENSFFNSRCFLQYHNRFIPPNAWNQVIALLPCN